MHFSKIELYNYGIYNGLHSLDLTDQIGLKNITLVGGMNGRGKTTILDSIFLCLYGRKASEYITGKRESYNKLLSERINKSASDKKTHIKLDIEMDDDEGTTISLKRQWKQVGKKIETSMFVEKNGIDDSYLSENWEYYVEELIPFGIAKFFFFDNEKISQIADDEAFDKIKDSIKSVMGVSTIESLCNHIEKIRKDKNNQIKKSENVSLSEEAEEIQSSIENYESNVQAYKQQRATLVPELERIANCLEETERTFWKKGGNLGLNHDEIVKEQQALKDKLNDYKEQALSLSSHPSAPLCLCKGLVTKTYNAICAEEDARAKKYSLPIISELYTSLLSNFKKEYESNTSAYKKLLELTSKQLSDLELIACEDNSSTITPLAKSLLERFITADAIDNAAEAYKINKYFADTLTALNQIEVHLSSSAEKNDTIHLLNEIKRLQSEKTRLEGDIKKWDELIHSTKYEIDALERKLNKTLLKIASEADTSDDNIRIIEYSTMTLEIMQEFVHRLQAQKVEELERNITSCFKFLAQKQAIITSISIHPETLDITLKDYNGGVLLKNQLSAGEKQMFAISILWGLALASGYKLPVIIDTPMARLDSAHRTNFINKYLPNASSQVIVLSTDEEIHGKYLEDISEYVNTTYTLVYDETSKCSSIHSGYFGGNT